MRRYASADAAKRAGISAEELGRLVELGIVAPDADSQFSGGAVRRIGMVRSLVAAGVPLDGLISQEVVDTAADAVVTFREIGPVELKGVTGAIRLYAAHQPG